MRHLLLSMLIALCLASTIFASDEAKPLRYTVRFNDAQNHYIDVEIQLPTNLGPTVELLMPVWTPGSYLIREYARHVERVQAVDEHGKPLLVAKKGKNRWVIKTGSATSAKVTYRVYCREMSVRTNWVDDELAILNGAPTFMTLADEQQSPHRVRLELPNDWKLSVTSMKRVSDGEPNHYEARDFDELVDSPILCGNPNVYRFNVGDREHLLVNTGEAGLWDGNAAARDVAKIVAEQQKFWGVVPYDRYIFFNLITESRGGLEHDNSTVLMTSRWNFRNRKSYVRWLSLVSHEFFHTWNVRRLRPKPLIEYDYESENYTKSLWIAEGITSYYENLCLIRAGVCSQKEFLELLTKEIETLQNVPGRSSQSLRASSHDTWIKFYRPDENSRNSRISYYTKGAVVGFLLDSHIRQLTNDGKSLDDVMRLLFDRHSGDRGYTPEDFRAIASEVAGTDLSDWFKSAVDSSDELQYENTLQWFGLRFGASEGADQDSRSKDGSPIDGGPNDRDTGDAGTPAELEANEQDELKVWIGITTQDKQGRLLVTRVRRDSPAFRAGINADDEILALGDFRVIPSQWEARLKQFQPGDEELLLIARREKLRRIPITFDKKPPAKQWHLSVATDASDDQRRHFHDWLGLEQQPEDE